MNEEKKTLCQMPNLLILCLLTPANQPTHTHTHTVQHSKRQIHKYSAYYIVSINLFKLSNRPGAAHLSVRITSQLFFFSKRRQE